MASRQNIPQTMLTMPTWTIFLMSTSLPGLIIRPRSPGQVVCHGDHGQESDGAQPVRTVEVGSSALESAASSV